MSPQPSSEATPLAAELTDEAIRAWTRRSRAASGRGPKIEDPAALAKLVTLALAGNDDAPTQRHQGRAAAPAGSGSGVGQRERGSARPNSKGPGLTNRDLRKTTPHTSEEVIGA